MKTVACVLLLASLAAAADFQPARLLNVAPFKQSNPVVPVAVYDMFTVTVAIDGMGYSATYYGSRHLHSEDLIVGEMIPAKLEGTKLVIKGKDGAALKAKITRRERL